MKRVAILILLLAGCTPAADRVVLYSAQDQEFAEPLFAEFTRQSKLSIAPKFDTEANKSVGLAAELLAETRRPRCDVHWNNEILATIRLARAGAYAEYASPSAVDFPAWTVAKDRTWQAFAARARVLIINTNRVADDAQPKRLFDLTNPKWRGQIAMAKPMFGTTATQAACLFEVLGAERAKQFYLDLQANDVQIVAGNKQVAVKVASGEYAIGMTDTDDAMIEIRAGKPVAMIFPDREPHPDYPRLGVLYIPNTIALIQNAPNAAGGQKLIDYVLAKEPELATGGGHQIPLNPKVSVQLPKEMLRPEHATRMAVDFERAADMWDDVQTFLRERFAR